jgi:CHAT domain-containing protein
MVAGFTSERWPASNQNPDRFHVGTPGRIKSESAGNPLLEGQKGNASQEGRSKLARRYRQCSDVPTSLGVLPKKMVASGPSILSTSNNLAASASIKAWNPLPQTAWELCSIARTLGVPASEIHLGAGATEAAIKLLSDQGMLEKYRIIHIATHGAIAGNVRGIGEPGLILTPPKGSPTRSDDGYLAASEVAQLKLDADWVILSACNTAAGEDAGGDPLSGLARAFLYAGARAVLASNWEVYTTAAALITTRAIEELRSRPDIGSSEALRVAMTEMIVSDNPGVSHPTYWAPFILVGEGAGRIDTAGSGPRR